jgi:hypothetical protein
MVGSTSLTIRKRLPGRDETSTCTLCESFERLEACERAYNTNILCFSGEGGEGLSRDKKDAFKLQPFSIIGWFSSVWPRTAGICCDPVSILATLSLESFFLRLTVSSLCSNLVRFPAGPPPSFCGRLGRFRFRRSSVAATTTFDN